MKMRYVAVVTAALGLLALAGCTKTPEEKLLGHLEQALSIAEAEAASPDKAAAAIEAYAEANKAEIDALAEELRELGTKLSDQEKKERADAIDAQASQLTREMMEFFEAHPEIAKHEGVTTALRRFLPF